MTHYLSWSGHTDDTSLTGLRFKNSLINKIYRIVAYTEQLSDVNYNYYSFCLQFSQVFYNININWLFYSIIPPLLPTLSIKKDAANMKVGIGVITMMISHFHKFSFGENWKKKKWTLLNYWNSHLQSTCVDSDQITHILQTFLKQVCFKAFNL